MLNPTTILVMLFKLFIANIMAIWLLQIISNR